jgi:tRNA1Val (adenine37-N6)-methyltransferase
MHEHSSDCELHELFDGRLKLYQPVRGYRFSVDSLLLAGFARGRCAGFVADLGAGCGVLPLLLARRDGVVHVTAVEIQQELADLVRRNSELNGCSGKISVLCGDVRAIKKVALPESFDAVVTNPPFYPVASGRINPLAQKAAARHEVHGGLDDFIAAGAYLLKRGGRCMAVYSAARLADLLVGLRKKSLEPKTLQFVHARSNEPAAMVLAEAVKGAGAEMKIEPPLVLYESQGVYSGQARELFASL